MAGEKHDGALGAVYDAKSPAEVAALVIDNDLPIADEDEPIARAG